METQVVETLLRAEVVTIVAVALVVIGYALIVVARSQAEVSKTQKATADTLQEVGGELLHEVRASRAAVDASTKATVDHTAHIKQLEAVTVNGFASLGSQIETTAGRITDNTVARFAETFRPVLEKLDTVEKAALTNVEIMQKAHAEIQRDIALTRSAIYETIKQMEGEKENAAKRDAGTSTAIVLVGADVGAGAGAANGGTGNHAGGDGAAG